jgi:hypothetical protein
MIVSRMHSRESNNSPLSRGDEEGVHKGLGKRFLYE